MQRPSHYGVKAVLQSGPLQQADDERAAHVFAGNNHREQDRGPYWHLDWTPAAGIQRDLNNYSLFLTSIFGICLHLTIAL